MQRIATIHRIHGSKRKTWDPTRCVFFSQSSTFGVFGVGLRLTVTWADMGCRHPGQGRSTSEAIHDSRFHFGCGHCCMVSDAFHRDTQHWMKGCSCTDHNSGSSNMFKQKSSSCISKCWYLVHRIEIPSGQRVNVHFRS